MGARLETESKEAMGRVTTALDSRVYSSLWRVGSSGGGQLVRARMRVSRCPDVG